MYVLLIGYYASIICIYIIIYNMCNYIVRMRDDPERLLLGVSENINKKPDIATMSGARMPIYASQ
jgi:hypothetical protein